MRVDVLRDEAGIENFVIWGDLPEGGEVFIDPYDSVQTIYGLRPGCSEADLHGIAGRPDRETIDRASFFPTAGRISHGGPKPAT